MLDLISKKVKLSMRILKLVNGSNSGRHLPSLFSDYPQVSIFSRSIKVTELHPFNGWLRTGTGGKFQDSSKTDQDGILKKLDIVMTMTT